MPDAVLAPDHLFAEGRIPLGLKLAYTAFMAVLLPVYLANYGPTNFLYFCDVALLLTLVGIWRENALLISMPAVGILVPQIVWAADFAAGLFGSSPTGMTAYMFNQEASAFLRGLSLFHGWLPFLLAYLVWRIGYDRRAAFGWTPIAWLLLVICYAFMPGPMPDAGNLPVNINYVFGMSDAAAQTWMPARAWFGLLCAAVPLLMVLPAHLFFSHFAPAAEAR